MSDLGYTFTTPPYIEVVDGTNHVKFNIEGIEQSYDFTMASLDAKKTAANNTIQNFTEENMETDYFIEIMTALLNP